MNFAVGLSCLVTLALKDLVTGLPEPQPLNRFNHQIAENGDHREKRDNSNCEKWCDGPDGEYVCCANKDQSNNPDNEGSCRKWCVRPNSGPYYCCKNKDQMSAQIANSPTPTTVQPTDCGKIDRKFDRIVGGRDADPKDWPWMAALLLKYSNKHFCGGTLINERHVLTATHCIKRYSNNDITVRLGEYDFEKTTDKNPADFDVVNIINHQDFDNDSNENDIAILKLDRKSTLNQFVWPICLPPMGHFAGEHGYVIGWGTISYGGPVSSILQEVFIPVWSQDECIKAYPDKIKDTMICVGEKAGGKDSCQGDSGGPFFLYNPETSRWFVAGIVSWGNGCARENRPGVYTRVNKYLEWITLNSKI